MVFLRVTRQFAAKSASPLKMALLFNTNSKTVDVADPPVTVAAFGNDPETSRILDLSLTMEGVEGVEIAVASLSQVIWKYRKVSPPRDLIVDITDSDDPLSNLEELASLCPPNIRVYVLGTVDSIDFYRRLTSLGVAGYLIKPFTPDRLLDMLARKTQEESKVPISRRQGKTFSVIGLQGGVGTTSLAINIGWGLSQLYHRQTSLVDLDLIGGSLALDLGVSPASGFSELLANPKRLDEFRIDQFSTPVADRLSLVASDTPSLEPRPDPTANVIQNLARHLSFQVSFSVMDLSRGSIEKSLPVLEISHCRVLVMDKRLASLRDIALLLKGLADGTAGRTVIVLNQSRPPALADFTKPQIAEAIGHEISVELPYVKGGLVDPLSPMRPMISRHGVVAQRLRALVTDLAGLPPKQPWYTGLWSSRRH